MASQETSELTPKEVDWDSIGLKPHRWRRIVKGQTVVDFWGYQAGDGHDMSKVWFGYTAEQIPKAPCNLCGGVGQHIARYWYAEAEPTCTPETSSPSMGWHGCPMYRAIDGWREVPYPGEQKRPW